MVNIINNIRAWYNRPKGFIGQLVEAVVIIVPIAFLIRTFGYGLYEVPSGSMETTMLVGDRFLSDKFTVLFSSIKRGDTIAFNAPEPYFKYSKNYWVELFQRYVWGPQNFTKRVIGIPGDEVKGVVEDGKPVVYLKKKDETDFIKLDEPYLNKYPLIVTPVFDSKGNVVKLDQRSYDPAKKPQDQPFYRLTKADVELGKEIAKKLNIPDLVYPETPSMDHRSTEQMTPELDTPGLSNGNVRSVDNFHIKLGDNQYWLMGDNRLGSADSRSWGPLDGKLIHGKIVYRLWSFDSAESWWIWDLIKHPIDFWSRIRWSRCFQTIH